MMNRFALRALCACCVALSVAWPRMAAAQASPYVPNLDASYADLDALIAAGLVTTTVSERPYSRMSFARLIDQADKALAQHGAPAPARVTEALQRLESTFASEIQMLHTGATSGPFVATLRSISTDGTWADSPSRIIPTSYTGAGNTVDTFHFISAQANPFLQRNEGRYLADGGTQGAEAVLDLGLGQHLAAELHPRAWVASPRDSSTKAGITLFDAYLRGLLGNIAVEAGRNHVMMGHGELAGPLVSTNVQGFPLVRASLEDPVGLPGFLARFGTLQASAMIADIGGVFPHSKLVTLDGVLRVSPNFELTGTILNRQGGTGAPSAPFIKRVLDVFLIPPNSDFSDKEIGAGALVRLPAIRAQFYLDGMTADDHSLFGLEAHDFADTYQSLWIDATWITGVKFTGLGPSGRADLWTEAQHAGVRPYTDGHFPSGMTFDQRVIGDALGPLGESWATGLDWHGQRQTFSIATTLEQYHNADVYEIPLSQPRIRYTRIVANPPEERTRFTGTWRFDPAAAGRAGVQLMLGAEHVTEFDFQPGSRWNGIGQLTLTWRW